MARPHLPDVTLCCIDTEQPRAALRALRRSQAQCDFARTVLFTHEAMAEPGIDVQPIAQLSDVLHYSLLIFHDIARHIATSHVLFAQWDGFVLDGARWEPGFLGFDYIGAPWRMRDGRLVVGNGGFSLRSRRLLAALAAPGIVPTHPEDFAICLHYRDRLEAEGLRFADPDTGLRFAVEMVDPGTPSFGFHGVEHLARTVPSGELPGLLAELSDRTLAGAPPVQLLRRYVAEARWREAAALLGAMTRGGDVADVQARLAAAAGGPAAAAAAMSAINRFGRAGHPVSAPPGGGT